jgi:hypothetical protein
MTGNPNATPPADSAAPFGESEPPMQATILIDITPTWQQALGSFLRLLEDGDADGKLYARRELYRMAGLADKYVALVKAETDADA